MTPREKDLFALVRAFDGDMRAIGELYDRHTPAMHAIATALLGPESEADEVVRAVWRDVWNRALPMDRRNSSIGAWLTMAARDHALDRLKLRGAPSEAERLVAPGMRAARVPAEGSAEQQHARAALEALPALERDALQTALVERMPPERVAERVEVPVATVRELLRNALDRLATPGRTGQPT